MRKSIAEQKDSKPRDEQPPSFTDEDGVFCDKPSDLPDFCNKWGGWHHDKAEVPGIVIGCPRLCNTPDRLCTFFIFTEGISIAKLLGLIGSSAGERTRWMFNMHNGIFHQYNEGMYDEAPEPFGD